MSTKIRYKSRIVQGLLLGRVRAIDSGREPSYVTMSFDEALAAATLEELDYALSLMISKPHVKRTWRNKRMKAIADKMLKNVERHTP